MEIRTFVKNGGKGGETKDAEMERAGEWASLSTAC